MPENVTFQENGCKVEKSINRRNQHINSDAKQKKTFFLNKKMFFLKLSSKKNFFLMFFFIIDNLKAGKCFLILWSAYSCYIQVGKHFIQYVNCIFIDSETNYLMNYNTNLYSNTKLHNYNLVNSKFGSPMSIQSVYS